MAGIAKDSSLTGGSLRGVTGPLVKVPVPAYVSATNGTATVVSSTNATPDNPDGFGAQVNLVVPAAIGNNAVLRTELFGRVVGIRFLRRVVTTIMPFDVVIDGVAYPVDVVTPKRDNLTPGVGAVTDYEASFIVASNLSDSLHTVEVHVGPDPALTNNNSLFLFGFVVERGRGYNDVAPLPRVGYVGTATTLATSSAGITTNLQQAFSELRFVNTDSIARIVTVYGPDGTTIFDRVYLAAAGSSGDVGRTVFNQPKRLQGWQWKADAGSVVKAWAVNA